MKSHYHCGMCETSKPATEEHWMPSILAIGAKNPNRTGIGYCRPCSNTYQKAYTDKLKESRLTRSRKPSEKNVIGKLYIIGPKENKNGDYPYKIGISTGTTIQPRLVSLQTSHWMELSVVYESKVLNHVRKVESKLHSKYRTKKIRGEWYRINKEDISDIINQVKSFENEVYCI